MAVYMDIDGYYILYNYHVELIPLQWETVGNNFL